MDDFIELLKRNFQTISEGQDDKKIGNTTKITYKKYIKNYIMKYQPSGAGGTRSPPAMPHLLQHLTTRLIKNGRRGLERG